MHDHKHDTEHTHSHDSGAKSVPTELILKYMLDHNIQHVVDAEEFAKKLSASGNVDAADLINEAVTSYKEGNEKMSSALEALKKAEGE